MFNLTDHEIVILERANDKTKDIISNLVKDVNFYKNLSPRLERGLNLLKEAKLEATNEEDAYYYEEELEKFAKNLIRYGFAESATVETIEKSKLENKSENKSKKFYSFSGAGHLLINGIIQDENTDEDLQMDDSYSEGHILNEGFGQKTKYTAGGKRVGAGNKTGSKRVSEVKKNTTVKVLFSKKKLVLEKAKKAGDKITLGKLLDKAMDDYLSKKYCP